MKERFNARQWEGIHPSFGPRVGAWVVIAILSQAGVAAAMTGADAVPASTPAEAAIVEPTPEASDTDAQARKPAFEPSFRLESELIGGFGFDTKRSHSEFELDRAELGLRFDVNRYAGAEIRIEAFRSAAPGSLLGLDGNSLALRIKRAQGVVGFELEHFRLQGRLGVTQDLWVETLEGQYDFRGMSPLMAEWSGFYDTSDVGGSVRLTSGGSWLGGDALQLGVSLTNGEGRRESERNSGKDLSVVASVQPVVTHWLGAPLRVGVHAMVRDGSLGVGNAKDHRRAVSLTVNHPRVEAGWEWSKAIGFLGDSTRNASGHGVWAGGQIIESWLGLSARYDRLRPDHRVDDQVKSQWQAALFTDLGTRLPQANASGGRVRIFAGLQSLRHDAMVSPAPGVVGAGDELRLMIWIAANGGVHLPF